MSEPGKAGLGSKGVWGFNFDAKLLKHELQNVHAYTDKTTRCLIKNSRNNGLRLGGKSHHSINQSANQSITQSIEQSNKQTINQPIYLKQSIKPNEIKSNQINESVNQANKQSINRPINQ